MKRRSFIRLMVGLFTAGIFARNGFSKVKEISGQNDMSPSRKKTAYMDGKPVVIKISDEKAVRKIDYGSNYIDAIDSAIVSEMLHKGLKRFTDSLSIKRSWEKILNNPGKNDKIAIKPNFNGVEKEFREVIASPQLLNAILYGLIEEVGLKAENIYIYDMTRIIPQYLRERIKYKVNFIQGYPVTFLGKIRKKIGLDRLNAPDMDAEINMKERITGKSSEQIKCYLPKLISEADHIINVPILKGHMFVMVSGSLKNHFGTVRFSDSSISPKVLHPPKLDRAVVDINSCSQIKNKTRIAIADAIMVSYDGKPGTGPLEWKTFSNSHPSSLFIARDPVALDSVLADHVENERKIRGLEMHSYEYIALAGKENIGVFEHTEGSMKYESIDYQDISI